MMQGTGQLPPQSMLNERYLILKVVGRGGMGCVYRTMDTRMNNRVVAIKEMSQSRLSPEALLTAQQHFAQEAEILQKLTPHSHLPTFYEAFSEEFGDQRRSYLVMDFIEGRTLRQVLSETPANRLELAATLHYAGQLCDVLSYLHQQSPPVVFRDLKPSNIIIGSHDTVYLIDFGIARHFKPGQSGDTDCFISNGYSAPENFGKAQTDPRSDLFSLGATLHQCLTGEDPGRRHLTYFDFSPVRAHNPQVPQALEDLIMQMVATEPEHRPASAEEVNTILNQMMRAGASPTVRAQPVQVDESSSETQPYYNPRIAREVQFRIEWSRFNRLPGHLWHLGQKALHLFAIIATWVLCVFLPFCRQVGQRAIDLVQSMPSRWEQFRQSRRNKIRARRPLPAPPSPGIDRARKVLETVAQARVLLSASSGGPPHLFPLFGVLSFAFISSLYMIARQHISPWLVLFLFGLCFLCLAFFAATRRAIDRVNQAILAVTLLAILLVCALLLSRPDIATFIRSITTAQVMAAVLVFLGMASLLRPFEQDIWLEHIIVSMGVGLCAFLQIVLGTQELAWLPSSWSTTLSAIAALILGISAIISLFRAKKPFSFADRLAVAFATACYAGQLIAFGNQALQPFASGTPWSAMTLNVILIVTVASLALLSFYFDTGAWIVIARLSLLVSMLVSAVLLLFVSIHLTSFALSPSFDFLAVKYFDPTRLDQFLINSMVAAASIIAFVLVRGGSFLLVDLLLVIAIVLPPLLLQNTFSPGLVPSYLLTVKQIVVPVTGWCIMLSLLLLVISAMFPFFSESDLLKKVAIRVDKTIAFLGYMLLSISAGTCLLFLWVFGYNEGITTGVFSQISTNLFLLAPIGLASIIAAWKMLLAGHRLLYSVGHAEERNQEEKQPWDMDEHTEIKGLTFTPLDRLVMFTVAFYLALLLGAMPEGFPAIVTDLRGIEPPGPYALWLALSGLFIAASGALGWLRRSSTQYRQSVFVSILLTVSGCLLIASGSLVFAFIRPLFVFASLAAVILLMLGLLLATWGQEEAHQTGA